MNYRKRASILYWVGSGLLILWLFVSFGSFYVIQKPFTLTAAGAITNALLDLLTAVWLGLLGLGLGHRLLRWLNLPENSKASTHPSFQPFNSEKDLLFEETLILGCGLGLGALGLVTLGLGLAGLFYPVLFVGISLLLTVLLCPDFLAVYRRRHRSTGRLHGFTLIYMIAVGLLTLAAGALLPPIDWDGLFYHLTAPKIFIRAHRIIPGIDIPHFNFPFLSEMLFTYALLLRGDIAAKLIHTLYGVLLAGLVYLIACRHLGRETGRQSVLIFLSMPLVVTLAGWAYNDLALAFYQLAALYAWLNYRFPNFYNPNSQIISQISQEPDSPNPSWLILSGIFAGLAISVKYTGFVGPLTIGLIIVWGQVAGSKLQVAGSQSPAAAPPPPIPHPPSQIPILHSPFTIHHFSPLLSFLLSAFLVALPWYLKNFFFTGNPFYPFLSGVFDGVFWDQFRAQWYAQAGTGIGFDLKTLAALPVLAMLGIRDVNYFDGRTGPLILAFLPLILLYGLFRYRARVPARPPALDILLIFALAQFLFWALGVIWSNSLWQSRLLLPCLVALSPVVGWLWQDLSHLDRPNFSMRRFAKLLIGLALALNLIELNLTFIQINPLAYLTGSETRSEYLTRRLGAYYATMAQMNDTLPAQAVVLFLWEPRSYFCQMECRPDSILDQLPHAQYLYGDAANIVAAWKQAGVTHILLHRQGLEFIKREDTKALHQPALDQLTVLEAHYFELVFDIAGAYQVFALK